jgi:hypothetical protein
MMDSPHLQCHLNNQWHLLSRPLPLAFPVMYLLLPSLITNNLPKVRPLIPNSPPSENESILDVT